LTNSAIFQIPIVRESNPYYCRERANVLSVRQNEDNFGTKGFESFVSRIPNSGEPTTNR